MYRSFMRSECIVNIVNPLAACGSEIGREGREGVFYLRDELRQGGIIADRHVAMHLNELVA